MQNLRALGAPPPDPRASGGWGLGAFPPNPQPPAAGGFAPSPPLASVGWGLRPQTPQTSPHWEFLATRLHDACPFLTAYQRSQLPPFITHAMLLQDDKLAYSPMLSFSLQHFALRIFRCIISITSHFQVR